MPDTMNRIHFNKIGVGGGGGGNFRWGLKRMFFYQGYRRRPITGEGYKKRDSYER